MIIRKNNVLLKGTTKLTTDSGIILPGAKADNIERKRYVKEIEVVGVGEEVEDLKIGDKVVVYQDVLMKLAYNVIHFMFDENGRKEELDKGDFYIIVPEEEIKAKL